MNSRSGSNAPPNRDLGGAIGKDANLPKGDSRTRAVALRYEHARGAPSVVAKGSGVVADEILRRAEEAGVFVHKSRELVGMLMQVDLDARVPAALYTAVAEVLAWVYRQDERVAQRLGPIKGAPGGSVPPGAEIAGNPAVAAKAAGFKPATPAAPIAATPKPINLLKR
jgi:flagellar biosynthesis protein